MGGSCAFRVRSQVNEQSSCCVAAAFRGCEKVTVWLPVVVWVVWGAAAT
jgi:hypothetical protein